MFGSNGYLPACFLHGLYLHLLLALIEQLLGRELLHLLRCDQLLRWIALGLHDCRSLIGQDPKCVLLLLLLGHLMSGVVIVRGCAVVLATHLMLGVLL